MSNPLSVQTSLSSSGTGFGAGSSSITAQNPVHAAAAKPAAKPVALFVNPSFRFDPTVGLVVIQFHDNSGTVSNTIPSARQLEAYRTHQETPPGEAAPQPAAAPVSAPVQAQAVPAASGGAPDAAAAVQTAPAAAAGAVPPADAKTAAG